MFIVCVRVPQIRILLCSYTSENELLMLIQKNLGSLGVCGEAQQPHHRPQKHTEPHDKRIENGYPGRPGILARECLGGTGAGGKF